MIDYHVHSTRSFDGRDCIDAFCRRAAEIGLREICFTEHVDFDPSDEGFGYYDHGAYRDAVAAARDLHGGRLAIRMGVEVDYQPRFDGSVRRWLEPLAGAFDFVMGSVHSCGPDGVFLGGQRRFGHVPLRQLYEHYLRDCLTCIRTGLFDGLAHLDYIRRQATGVYERVEAAGCEGLFDEVLAAAVEAALSLDINAKHDHDGTPRMPVPTTATLRRYVELGGRLVTIGSDAHCAGNLGRGIRGALDSAREAGLTHVAAYRGRERRLLAIAEADGWEDPS